ncbi:MAG: SpoIIE family protein phosphatase [Oscillospiraceae bacterium]|nr:SpoIIE family protein phosphatase [Oscillospiraceae bacterium]
MKVKKRETPTKIIPYAAQHIGRRKEQQDSFVYSDMYNECGVKVGAVGVIADGMGGYRNGKIAGKVGADNFFSEYTRLFNGNVNSALIKAVYHANDAVNRIDGAGTTLVSAIIEQWRLYWISVGDSRIYIMRNGLLRRLNIDNNYASVLRKKAEKGEISFAEAFSDPKANALTSYLGIDELTEFDYNDCEFPLLCGDKIVLCSDGLYRAISEKEAADVLSASIGNPADALLRRALSKGKRFQDNITVIVINII